MTELDLDVSDREIADVFQAFVTAAIDNGDSRWERDLRALEADLKRKRRRHAWMRLLRRFRRSQRAVDVNYSSQWLARPMDQQVAPMGPGVLCQWGERRMYAHAVSIKRVHLLYFARIIARLKPARVLEVGSGNGLNLFILAGCFPDVDFTGLELTEGGTRAALATRRMPALGASVVAFSPQPIVDPVPFRRIHIVRGSAAQLPFPDRSFDLVFTALALEQMEEIRPRALSEIGRVARTHTAMIEPFYDWNESGRQRDWVVANDYFSGRIADLPSFGLEPILVSGNMPSKVTNRPGLVVCRVR